MAQIGTNIRDTRNDERHYNSPPVIPGIYAQDSARLKMVQS